MIHMSGTARMGTKQKNVYFAYIYILPYRRNTRNKHLMILDVFFFFSRLCARKRADLCVRVNVCVSD